MNMPVSAPNVPLMQPATQARSHVLTSSMWAIAIHAQLSIKPANDRPNAVQAAPVLAALRSPLTTHPLRRPRLFQA
jgi:hypothetical protein